MWRTILIMVLFATNIVAQERLMPISNEQNEHPKVNSEEVLSVKKRHKQKTFKRSIPPGNYSGIVYLGENLYAVVDDKKEKNGFYLFEIDIDRSTGKLKNAEYQSYISTNEGNKDAEDITFFSLDSTLFIAQETDNRIREITFSGQFTGREIILPDAFSTALSQYGIESLTYNASTHRFWTTSESTLKIDGTTASYTNKVKNRLRLLCFNDSLKMVGQFFYEMDEPKAKRKAEVYAIGVSALCALDNGQLLVLEREFYVPKHKIGSYVICKIYTVTPQTPFEEVALDKTLLTKFRTRLNLTSQHLANYEGMCLAQTLEDGSPVLLLISDSQNRYANVLKDWFKTITLKFEP